MSEEEVSEEKVSEEEVSEEKQPEFAFHLPTSQEIEEAKVKWPGPVQMPVVPGHRVYRPVKVLAPAAGSTSGEEGPISVFLRTALLQQERSDKPTPEPKKPRG